MIHKTASVRWGGGSRYLIAPFLLALGCATSPHPSLREVVAQRRGLDDEAIREARQDQQQAEAKREAAEDAKAIRQHRTIGVGLEGIRIASPNRKAAMGSAARFQQFDPALLGSTSDRIGVALKIEFAVGKLAASAVYQLAVATGLSGRLGCSWWTGLVGLDLLNLDAPPDLRMTPQARWVLESRVRVAFATRVQAELGYQHSPRFLNSGVGDPGSPTISERRLHARLLLAARPGGRWWAVSGALSDFGPASTLTVAGELWF